MHFALPPRRAPHTTPYQARTQRVPLARRVGPKQVVVIVFAFFALLFLLGKLSGSSDYVPAGTPAVVLVTTLDLEGGDKEIQEVVKQNRIEYAQRHGYEVFFTNVTAYELGDAPKSWAKVPSMRHAMTIYPHSTWFWFLEEHCLVMNPELAFTAHVGNRQRLEQTMIQDVPVVPPDSVIRTFRDLAGDRVDLLLTQDPQGLSTASFVIRQGDWSKFFLDAWFDPLYRTYNFQKAETHALEHIVQWHGTILGKLALVPLRMLNSYATGTFGVGEDMIYADGDFVVNLSGCAERGKDCRAAMAPYLDKLYPRVPGT